MKNTAENTQKEQLSKKLSRVERKGVFKHESDENAGRTFGIFKYETFAGDMITPSNRRSFLMLYFMEYLKKMVEKADVDAKSPITDEHKAEAMLVARDRVTMNIKAYKAYAKGQQYFRFRGKKYMTPTVERIEEMQEKLGEVKGKYTSDELAGIPEIIKSDPNDFKAELLPPSAEEFFEDGKEVDEDSIPH
jgi:hypothetical protein